jgi:catechol 2,3-dioxygenase-like lactoylglutathione lyase family enzyme
MKLNHVNLAVPDVFETASFFETYFGFSLVTEKNDGALLILSGEDGFILALSKSAGPGELMYPRPFHVGFIRNSSSEVDQMVAALGKAGMEIEAPRMRHDRWSSYFTAPGGIRIEIST